MDGIHLDMYVVEIFDPTLEVVFTVGLTVTLQDEIMNSGLVIQYQIIARYGIVRIYS